jgi:hypothetical protein
MTVIVDDPELAAGQTVTSTAGVTKRYFGVDDGGASYWIVARDLDHAKQLLLDAGVDFTDDDGDTAAINDPRFASLEWEEISPERASQVMCWSEDGRGKYQPLAEYEIGDWFCSEY